MARLFWWGSWPSVPSNADARSWCCRPSSSCRGAGLNLASYAGRQLCRSAAAWVLDGHHSWCRRRAPQRSACPWACLVTLRDKRKFEDRTGQDPEHRFDSVFSATSSPATTLTPKSCLVYPLPETNMLPPCYTLRFATITKRCLFVFLLRGLINCCTFYVPRYESYGVYINSASFENLCFVT